LQFYTQHRQTHKKAKLKDQTIQDHCNGKTSQRDIRKKQIRKPQTPKTQRQSTRSSRHIRQN
ncbi:hypothetical protein, partial [Rhizobium brockwellii]|uniref:hypothetical protein n=1 Tax=Rhizobium brockwellii TaxID=3019932 RepID=UPI003F9CC39F